MFRRCKRIGGEGGRGRRPSGNAVAFVRPKADTAAARSIPARLRQRVAVPPIDYLVLRTLRRWAPQRLVDWMLDRGVVLRAGRDTVSPDFSIETYREAGNRLSESIVGSDVLVFGFGGSLGVALALLEAGAAHVYLQDPYAPVRRARDRRLPAERMANFFNGGPKAWEIDPSRVTVVRKQLPEFAADHPACVDWVVSSSVFEHVEEVEANVAACARITRPGGINVHEIDLRDHFFKHPFEMLCYSERTWRRWLNASNHLNRWRVSSYEEAFRRHFREVRVRTVMSLPEQLALVKGRIRKEFLTGDDGLDSVGVIVVEARRAE